MTGKLNSAIPILTGILQDFTRIIHIHFLMTMMVALKFIHRRTLIIPTFLNKSREYFKSECLVLEERFDFSQFDPNQGVYKSLHSDRIIFCEGFRVTDNPYFKSLPLSPTKGEVMTIRIPSLESILIKLSVRGFIFYP